MAFAYLRMGTQPPIEGRLTEIETNGGNKSLFFSHGTLSRIRKVTRFYGKTVFLVSYFILIYRCILAMIFRVSILIVFLIFLE